MKKIPVLLIMMAIGLTGLPAQNIPDNITKAQAAKYSQTEKLAWKHQGEFYDAFFTYGGKSCFVRYDKNAEALDVQEGIEQAALPSSIRSRISAQYPGYKYENVTFFYKKDPAEYQEDFLQHTAKHYEVFLLKGHQSYKLYYSPKGKLLNKPEMKLVKGM
jgi:hypothetical protein